MCGLFGYFLTDPSADQSDLNGRLAAAQAALYHRGPDDRGLKSFSISQGSDLPPFELTLGHTRLSIIDLSPGGHQPMHSGDGRFIIVFNGEIYNYRELRQELKAVGASFQTDSDTEVLLAAWAHWGIGGLRRLTGMFAFAVYDRRDESLTLVRDAFGIKPMFFQQDASGFRFASEISALVCLLEEEPELNYQQAYDYLLFGGHDNAADTFYQGIKHLLPGHWLRVDLKNYRVGEAQRWWWPSIKERRDVSFEDAATKVRELFLDSVRKHLRSDVPIAAALSGGVDSSAIVCAMRYLEPDMPIHTFTYVNRGAPDDEEYWADIVNDAVGAIPHKIFARSIDLSDDLEDMIRGQGEPFGSTSIYAQYRVFQCARAEGFKVMLDGQGADECLGGYEGYPKHVLRELIVRLHWLSALHFVSDWSTRFRRSRKNLLLSVLGSVFPAFFQRWMRTVRARRRHPDWMLPPSNYESDDQKLPSSLHGGESYRYLMSQLRKELVVGRLARLLRYEDRNSMRFSIESRVPFLSLDFVEFMLSLPATFLVSSTAETKSVFREAMRGIVPDAVLDRTDKVGFSTPEASWFKANFVNFMSTGPSDVSDQFIDMAAAKSEIMKSLEEDIYKPEFWRLVNFQKWRASNRIREQR